MLHQIIEAKDTIEKIHDKRSDMGEQLAYVHRQLQELGKPILIIMDGFESSGRSALIKDLVKELDPRYYEVNSFSTTSEADTTYPYLRQYMGQYPRRGQIIVLDRSYYHELLMNRKMSDEELEFYLEDIRYFEQLMINDEIVFLKFFVVQSKEKMKERVDELRNYPFRHVFVDEKDLAQLKRYDKYLKHFERVLARSQIEASPWQIIVSDDEKNAGRMVLKKALEAMSVALIPKEPPVVHLEPVNDRPLDTIDLSESISEDEYDRIIRSLQHQAMDMLYALYEHKVSGVVVFEGTDAAGKGGAIKRLTRRMDPRLFNVSTTAAPTKEEIGFHYLWRFYKTLPTAGHITIYDRSWYGRLMVEKIEHLTPEHRTDQAYEEINGFEKSLIHDGLFVFKYLIIIDKEEQLARFKQRQEDPMKTYKITDEDWRNREKFEEYEDKMNDMVSRTSTDYAPWILISGQDKKAARIKVLEHFIQHVGLHLEKVLDQRKQTKKKKKK